MGRTDEFEWDDDKDRLNQSKHGIPLRFAVILFDDPHLVEKAGKTIHGELRFIAIGTLGDRVLSCVYAYAQSGRRRLISLRPASRAERRLYVSQMDQGRDRA